MINRKARLFRGSIKLFHNNYLQSKFIQMKRRQKTCIQLARKTNVNISSNEFLNAVVTH